jgi:hypothetical protein
MKKGTHPKEIGPFREVAAQKEEMRKETIGFLKKVFYNLQPHHGALQLHN